ncbi:hypothetical protein RHSIM_Rhsim13G0005700 [Rhododendron simsii]|uniref:RUNKEL ARM-repeat domain-containing protein n=1 Tax=Rhododendron simsii TaxID=118357 RepID=A0A834L6L4_RHOSS|nr:hypothetical protein RHSIM_Rhsim13G0005700 [Rhododendron simsii]
MGRLCGCFSKCCDSALRIQLASLIGLSIRHSTFINKDLENSGLLGSLIDGLRDKQEKVRKFSMAALGQLQFYTSTRNEHNEDCNLPECPSKDIKFLSGWQVCFRSADFIGVGTFTEVEDDCTQLYALRTIENICSQGATWASRLASQDVNGNLCYIFLDGKQENMKLTAGSCLAYLVRFKPPSIQHVVERLPLRDIPAALVKGSLREQQICLNLLNMAMLGTHMIANIGRHLLSLGEGKNLVPCLMSLIEQGSEVLGERHLFLWLSFVRIAREGCPISFAMHGYSQQWIDNKERLEALKSISNTHFLPRYPTLNEEEDPIPMYPQKRFKFLLGDLSTANVNILLCLALASAPELENTILSQLKVVRRIGNLLEGSCLHKRLSFYDHQEIGKVSSNQKNKLYCFSEGVGVVDMQQYSHIASECIISLSSLLLSWLQGKANTGFLTNLPKVSVIPDMSSHLINLTKCKLQVSFACRKGAKT